MRKQSNGAESCEVTFELPAEVGASTAHVCGDFNDWSRTASPLTRLEDGSFATVIILRSGHRYRFRYLLDDARWENDRAADDYVANEFGGDDSVVVV